MSTDAPPADQFPPETRQYPSFWTSCSAFYAMVQSEKFTVIYVDNNASQPAQGTLSSPKSKTPSTKKRRLSKVVRSCSSSSAPRSPNLGSQIPAPDVIDRYRIVTTISIIS